MSSKRVVKYYVGTKTTDVKWVPKEYYVVTKITEVQWVPKHICTGYWKGVTIHFYREYINTYLTLAWVE